MSELSWHVIIADAINRLLENYLQGQMSEADFVRDVASQDERLNNPKNIRDINLSAAWNYADSFNDPANPSHDFTDLDGIDWEVATRLLADTAMRVRAEQPIEDWRVLRYAR